MNKKQDPETYRGPSLPVKRWYENTVVRILLAVLGVALIAYGVMQIMGTLPLEELLKPENKPVDTELSSSSSSIAYPGSSFSSSRTEEPATTISFDGNGANGGFMEGINQDAGTQIALPACSFTRPSYLFTHWSTNTRKGAATKEYLPGDTYDVAGPVTFYANWQKATPLLRLTVKDEGEVLEGRFEDFDETCNHCVLVIENRSDFTQAFNVVFTYSTSSGTEKGVGYDQASAVAPGAFAILVGYDVFNAAGASFKLTASKPYGDQSSLDSSAQGEEVSATANAATIRLTSTSDEEVQIYKVRCVMMDEGGTLYAGDSFTNGAIAPGSSMEATFEPSSMFDYSAKYPIIPDFDKMQRAYFVDGHVGAVG